jgi:hypothetical protein
MAVTVPGLDLSILRGATQAQAGQAVLISGRFTAFGIGVPAFIRVFLEGPDYNPEKTHFDSVSSPFSGDYSVQVVPSKDGSYKVYSQAFPLPLVPTGPAFPEPLLLLPPIAESPQPPLVVGAPAAGGVNAQTPSGTQFLSTPSLSPIEVSVGAPAISIVQPGVTAPSYAVPTPPALPAAAIPTTYVIPSPPAAAPTVTMPTVPTAPVIVYPPTPTFPEVPEVPSLPEVTELQIPTFPSLPTSGMLGAPISNLPQQWTIGE